MESIDTAGAFARFGLGPRPGDLALVGNDARRALIAEIEDRTAAAIDSGAVGDTPAHFLVIQANQRARRAMAEARAAEDATAQNPPAAMPPQPANQIYAEEVRLRLKAALTARLGLVERLVAFWSNHFALDVDAGGLVRGSAGSFEREAIRPHVLGPFHDLLLAATRHPAMLVYLNNSSSFGPNSEIGRGRGRGLNENHGRELLELHTVGVNGGYTQEDVTEVARALTGWSFDLGDSDRAGFGRFRFRARAHEPGDRTIMGIKYSEGGVEQGEAVLADLARSPSTAHHIAMKLARHFVRDPPPHSLSERLAKVFLATDGDLQAVTLALLQSDQAWQRPAEKLKSPQEFVWSAVRAVAPDVPVNFIMSMLRVLGQPIWNPPSPAGFSDAAATWLAPDAMTNRLDVAEHLAGRAAGAHDPRVLVDQILGPSVSANTREAIDRAASPIQALSLLLMSPEFQRR